MKRFKIIILLLVISLICPYHILAQRVIKPILLNKSALSGIDLETVTLENEPDRKFFQRRILRGDDISVYVVSSQSWTSRMDNFAIDEVVYMLNGRARVNPDKGEALEFNSNEFFFIPKGYTGTWEIQAGNNYHYELSVIATQRSSTTNTAPQLPTLFDKNDLSGSKIRLDPSGDYAKVLTHGTELTVTLKAQKPKEVVFSSPAKEQLIHVLSGRLLITDSVDTEHTFYTGDFFVLPKGFTGKWKSEGHGLFKSLVIEKTS